jgi:nucleotide-binding universal stress UspA family protein
MENCKKIILVVKTSEVGERALKKSMDIIEENGCNKLGLLFVVDHDFFSGAGASYVKSKYEVDKGLEGIADAILRTMKSTIKESGKNIQTEDIILHGKTAEEIIKYVKENNIDILIIPRAKRGPIEKFITGGDITPFIEELKQYTKPIVIE